MERKIQFKIFSGENLNRKRKGQVIGGIWNLAGVEWVYEKPVCSVSHDVFQMTQRLFLQCTVTSLLHISVVIIQQAEPQL